MRRFRPRAGWRTPLRASSPGVWIAPAAATTIGASTRSRPRAAVAAVDVAQERRAVQAERAHAAVEELGVPSGEVPRHGTDADHALHLVEIGRHRRRVGVGDAVLGFPGAEDAVRRPETGAR